MESNGIRILGKYKSIDILRALKESKLSYGKIENIVGNPATTQRRLRELVSIGLIEREVQQDARRTVLYHLTSLGNESIEFLGKINKAKKNRQKRC